MSIETIEKFQGLYTNADKYSTPGSPSMHDWDIDMNDNLVKSKGYTKTTTVASNGDAYVTVNSIQISANAVLTISGTATDLFSASSTVILYDFSDTTFSNVIGNKMWNVSAVGASTLTLEGCNTGSLSGTSKTAKIDPTMQQLHGFCGSGVGVALSNIECQGAYYDSSEDYVYSFLANNAEAKSWLVKADKDIVVWSYAESSIVANCTSFNASQNGFFTKYGSNIIFTKNQTVSDAGTLTFSTTGSIVAYGTNNNPTGKYLEIHKERLWVGNIKAISNVTQTGKSWVQVSKFLPEKTDTRLSIVGSGIIFGNGTAKIIASTHTYKVGDTIYLSGIVFSGVQDDMNQRLYDIVGINTSAIIIEYNNVNTLEWSSGGSIIMRGATWGPTLTLYDDASQGAGLFRCDDNEDDAVMQLKSSFGALAILRQQNPYIFTGAIESGNQTLARPLNVSYGVVSPHTVVTAGGTWFISQYGVSKIEGTTIRTNQNQLDNVVDVSVIEPIRPTYEATTVKSDLLIHSINRYLLVHDPAINVTYVLDTLKANWFMWQNRLADRFLSVGENDYSVYKHLLFKLQTGNQVFSLTSYAAANMTSSYYTKIMAQESVLYSKVYNLIYSLIEGSSSSAGTNPIGINVYYNGAATSTFSFTWDVKAGSLQTWNQITTNASLSWNTVTTTATVTWLSLTGQLVAMMEKKKFRLGTARDIQIEIVHSDNSSVKISKLYFDYDQLDVLGAA